MTPMGVRTDSVTVDGLLDRAAADWGELTAVVTELGAFLLPIAQAVAAGADFRLTWRAPGPWV